MTISKKNQKRNLTKKTFTVPKSVCDREVENGDGEEEIDHHHVIVEKDRDQNHESAVQVANVVRGDRQETEIEIEASHVTEVTEICVGVIHVARVVMSGVLEAMFGDLDMTFVDLVLILGKTHFNEIIGIKNFPSEKDDRKMRRSRSKQSLTEKRLSPLTEDKLSLAEQVKTVINVPNIAFFVSW